MSKPEITDVWVDRGAYESLSTIAVLARKAWGQYSGHDVQSASGLMDAMSELEIALDKAGFIE